LREIDDVSLHKKEEFMDDDLKFILDRFSSRRARILAFYQENEEFKGLCQDFYTSAQQLDNLKKKILKDRASELEYRKLFLELESDLLKLLDAPASKRH
jgi:hypothetical protein